MASPSFRTQIDEVYRTDTNNQATDAQSSLQTTGADTDPIEDDLPVALIKTDTTDSTRMRLENKQLALAEVVEDNNSLKEGAAPAIADFLQHQERN